MMRELERGRRLDEKDEEAQFDRLRSAYECSGSLEARIRIRRALKFLEASIEKVKERKK